MANDLTIWWESAVKEGRALVKRTKDDLADLCDWLLAQKPHFTSQGYRADLRPDGRRLTWENFLLEIELAPRSVRRWLLQFDPETRVFKELEPPKKSEPHKVEAPKPPVKETPKHNHHDNGPVERLVKTYGENVFDDESEDDLSPDLGDGFDDVEQAIDTDPNDALDDIKSYSEEVLAEIQSVAGRHQVCNELVKYFRNKATELDRQAADSGEPEASVDFDLSGTPATVPDELEIF